MFRRLTWTAVIIPAVVLAALWLVLTAFFAAQFVVAGPLEWDEAFTRSRSFWMPWLPLLPAVYLLARLVIAWRLRWWWSAVIYTAVCVLRVSRSAIVNLDHVRELQPLFKGEHAVILHSGRSIPMTRGLREVEKALRFGA